MLCDQPRGGVRAQAGRGGSFTSRLRAALDAGQGVNPCPAPCGGAPRVRRPAPELEPKLHAFTVGWLPVDPAEAAFNPEMYTTQRRLDADTLRCLGALDGVRAPAQRRLCIPWKVLGQELQAVCPAHHSGWDVVAPPLC